MVPYGSTGLAQRIADGESPCQPVRIHLSPGELVDWNKTSATTIRADRLDTQILTLGGSGPHFANDRQSK